MKLIIAGSKHMSIESSFIDMSLKLLNIRDQVEEIVSSGLEGADWAGEEFSIDFLNKEAKVVPADWAVGISANTVRNIRMAEYADALLVIWDGKSSGTTDIKTQMLKLKKPIYEVILKSAST